MMPKNITIQKVIGILLRRIHLILISGIVVGLIFFLYTSFAIIPQYNTSSMIYIQNYGARPSDTDDAEAAVTPATPSRTSEGNSSNNATAQKIFGSDISGSSTLAANCIILFQNTNEITSLYNGCSVSMALQEGSFYVIISVTGPDPQVCANVANQVAEKCQEVYYNRFPYGTIGTIREAYVPSSPISLNTTRNTIIGVLIGFVAACLISVLLELIDTTIKSDDDLSSMYKVPVFAEIPDFESAGR